MTLNPARCQGWIPHIRVAALTKGAGDVDLWNLALAAIFFCAMGTFAGVAALYLTSTPVRPLAHQAAEIVLFCLFAIALFAVIATLLQTTREITPKRPRASLRLDFDGAPSLVRHHDINHRV